MECIFLQCLADRAAYQTKTYYCYFHFCPSFSAFKTYIDYYILSHV